MIGCKFSWRILKGLLRNAIRRALTSNKGTVATDPSIRGTECNVGLRKFN
jgi:hypothetical protein